MLTRPAPTFDGFLDAMEDRGLLSAEAVARARAAHATTGRAADVVLVELGLMREGDVAARLSEVFGLPEATLSPATVATALIDEVGPDFFEANQILPLASGPDRLVVAVADPFDRGAVDVLGYQVDRPVEIRIVPRRRIVETLAALRGDVPAPRPADTGTGRDDVERLEDVAREAPVIRLVAQVIQQAVDRGATDIHIEPRSDQVSIRFRCDGMLDRIDTVPKAMHAGLSTRIKILARLNIAERRLPQDGRMRTTVRGQDVDLRVSVLPTVHGESFVLRVLDRTGGTLGLDALGYDAGAIASLKRLAHLPNGIVLITGPTGSGKTTTLYSVLRERLDDAVKIFTVEDPVEYRLDGVTQLQVDPAIDLTFSKALRSGLRHDPDIILIGEIRDPETAQIAIQSALTGHLVFSTLHTNSAAGALTRLLDMGIDSYLIGATVRAVAAQRLLRRLCGGCGGKGCAACGGRGYDGRTVTYEILPVTPSLAQAIGAGTTEAELHARAVADGLRPMAMHAAGLIEAGLTSRDEVHRVLDFGADA